jgi:hypothetical protein
MTTTAPLIRARLAVFRERPTPVVYSPIHVPTVNRFIDAETGRLRAWSLWCECWHSYEPREELQAAGCVNRQSPYLVTGVRVRIVGHIFAIVHAAPTGGTDGR